MDSKNHKIKAGFTLIEIITVLFVISLGLVGILTLIVQNIQSQDYNKDNLIATQLAQEGIELVRRVRDNNWKALPARDFDYNLAAGNYYLDYRDLAPRLYNLDPAELILKQDDNGFYFHDAASAATSSNFSRLITLEKTSADSLLIRSRVTWGSHNRNYAYDLETILYDWY
ncbi:MAG: prepilin-type N-terminal cleavage/methylation domain-containing protein [Patescibacteria group bacterium]